MPYGSLQNDLAANARNDVQPEIGLGATEILWTDRYAYTVVEVTNSRQIIVQRDKAVNRGGHGHNDWSYEADPAGIRRTVTLRKNGRWVTKGESLKGGTRWVLGWRNENFDWEF